LKYTASTFGKFEELPKLDWYETIMMKLHHTHETWTFATNMYGHNPTSNTLKVWCQRYIRAYDTVAGTPSMDKGSVKLFNKNGGPVNTGQLGPNKTSGQEKADAVRSYLKSHSDILEIEVHDIPSINKPTGSTAGEHKERLLLFNCGLVGGGMRIQAEQYLDVIGGQPQSNWKREIHMMWVQTTFNNTGFRQIAPPTSVSAPRAANFVAGECW
jgi:hypothetical protein